MKIKRDKEPMCHFTIMEYDCGDNGNGGCDYFWVCKHCGHIKEHYIEWRE